MTYKRPLITSGLIYYCQVIVLMRVKHSNAYIPSCDCCIITMIRNTTVDMSIVTIIAHAISFLTKSLFLALITTYR